jgi:hypothetical protein
MNTSPLCGSVLRIPVHRKWGFKIDFLKAVHSKQIRLLKGLHFFDAWRLVPEMLGAPELQVNPRKENVTGPDGAEEAVEEPHSDDEATSTEGDSDTIGDTEDGLPWCPSFPDAILKTNCQEQQKN